MNDNDKEVKEYLEKEEVPEKISPDNIKKMLDENKPAEKRKNISVVGRFAAVAAACAVIVAGAAAANGKLNRHNNANPTLNVVETPSSESETADKPKTEETTEIQKKETEKAPYMNGAESYEQIYKMFRSQQKKQQIKDTLTYGSVKGAITNAETMMVEDEAVESSVDEFEDMEAAAAPDAENGDALKTSGSGEVKDFSETYNQEENVLEADITKTDGKNIYYLKSSNLNVAVVDNGEFIDSYTVDITPDVSYFEENNREYNVNVNDMYLYNDMIEVVGTVYSWSKSSDSDEDFKYYENDDTKCFVSLYTKGEKPELIGSYFQDGYYNDVRISPDGYMYLLSDYSNISLSYVDDCEKIEEYIPSCGTGKELNCMLPQDILLPAEPQDTDWLSYTVISSIDLNSKEEVSVSDTKALAGYTGNIYSSADNLYTTVGWEDTAITRISVSGGNIVPEASGTVEGFVNDQFSMSEYNGYFRIATSIDRYEYDGNFLTDALNIEREYEHISDNRLYVLDMDLNEVGRVENFGKNETVKSVNFSGDMAYVVTYERTDPLFAIDISDPAAPFITDEFKITGYSSYMQKWSDGLLLGFGVNADENAIETGVKLVMFDNSDPYDLKEVGFVSIDREDDKNYIYSSARWDRKALLIAPEKNLIGIPITEDNYKDDDGNYSYTSESRYVFFSYENGEFVEKGNISREIYNPNNPENYSTGFERAVYIGDYVYVLSAEKFVSADIDTITVKDETEF